MNIPHYWTASFLLVFALAGAFDRKGCAADAAVPRVNEQLTLRNCRGYTQTLQSLKGEKATVLLFVANDCPLANRYLPRLIDWEAKYSRLGVLFVAVHSNTGEAINEIAGHAHEYNIPFPVVKDFGHRLADAVGAERTPEVAVLDDQLVVRYRGAIDEELGVEQRNRQESRAGLLTALDELLAGQPFSTPSLASVGCAIDRRGQSWDLKEGVTYSRDVAPIVQARCERCHRPGAVAPFTLQNYDEVAAHAAPIAESLLENRMPPWHADARHGKFANERRLEKKELDTLLSWVNSGLARGADADLPKPLAWKEGWTLGEPDEVFQMPAPFTVPADGDLPYQRFLVAAPVDRDRWVQASEVRPGDPSVVHHVAVYMLQPGAAKLENLGVAQLADGKGNIAMLASWGPGDEGIVYPSGTALRLPKGTQIVIEMHYTPNGKVTADRTSFGLKYADSPPQFEVQNNIFGNFDFVIPPHAQHHQAEVKMRVDEDINILSFQPHLHWRGKSFRYEAHYPDGKSETLLAVPAWRFDWQTNYVLQSPKRIPKGTELKAVATWDNSAHNPSNPDPTKAIKFGIQSWDEMMVGYFTYVKAQPGLGQVANPAAARMFSPEAIFQQFDANRDDKITSDEWPAYLSGLALKHGISKDKPLTREDLKQLLEKALSKKPPAPAKTGDR